MEVIHLLSSVMGIAFVSGVNLYATILTVGLGIRFDLIHIPQELDTLSFLAQPYIIIASLIMYSLEFFADKIPWVDSLWDSIHTFIRPLGAVIICVKAVGSVDPTLELTIILLCGGIAFSSHSTKASLRLAVNHSPEPVSNIFISFAEDMIAIVGTWLALSHPLVMLIFIIVFIALFSYLSPKIYRIIKIEFYAVFAILCKFLKIKSHISDIVMFDSLPKKYSKSMSAELVQNENNFCILCFSGKGFKISRNCVGFLCKIDSQLFFLVKRRFHIIKIDFDIMKIINMNLNRGLLLDRLFLLFEKNEVFFYFLKDRQKQAKKIISIIETDLHKRA